MFRRLSAGIAIIAALVLGTSLTAWAHVTVQPGSAPKGSFSQLAFRVPNERDDADTVKLEVQLPADHPIAFVSIKPMPGWTITTKTTQLAKPLETEDGEITEAVTQVTWEGGKVAPGQYDDFSISAGPLPTDVDELVFKVVQTYSSGEEVAWVQDTPDGGPEPERPAPVLKLTEATEEEGHGSTATTAPAAGTGTGTGVTVAATPSQDDVDSANTKATIGIVVGALGLVAGTGGIVLSRRRSA
jgi:uncharacterized protein YcnI